LPSNIVMQGPVNRTRVLEEFLRSDLLIFPTLCDGFGLVVPEALSKGLPVLTTTRAGAADLIRDGENGVLVEAGSADDLLRGLVWAQSNRQRLASMRPAALETSQSHQWQDYRYRLRRVKTLFSK
jgi:glycosyltransferase involved in cell wall biosynthesis